MDVRRLHEPEVFLQAAQRFLLEDEARHNLLFGIATTLRDHPATHPSFDLWLVSDGDAVRGAAVQTPPYSLVVAKPGRDEDEVLRALVRTIAASGVRLPGVSGASPEVGRFADHWVQRVGGTWRARVEMGIYALRTVLPTPTAQGSPRRATSEERDLVVGLVEAFTDEAAPQMIRDRESTRRNVEVRLGSPPSDGGFWVWEDRGRIVSISGHGGPTPNGIRIGPVYTPPEHRGRGFATTLVAAQSSWLLAHGRRFCFLFTDLANPTSNALYRRIGYEWVCGSADLAFESEP